MRKLILDKVNTFVNENIDTFHQRKLGVLTELNLRALLKKKNPYLFKAKNINKASDLVEVLLEVRFLHPKRRCSVSFWKIWQSLLQVKPAEAVNLRQRE